MEPVYEVEEYVTKHGTTPFGQWLLSLKDKRAQAKLRARITRATFGNFGDWKKISAAPGLCEMRDHYGSGYRIYYSIQNQKLILLLAGSTKKDQNKAIAQAKDRLVDYRARTTNDGKEQPPK